MTIEVVNGLWVGTELSLMEFASIKSYMDLGYTYHLHTYNELKNVPEGCIIKDANETIKEEELFNEKNSVLPFTDVWKFMFIYKFGGVWVDLDLIAFKRFDDVLTNDLVFSSQRAMLTGAYASKLPVEPALSFIYSKNPNNEVLYNLYTKLLNKKGKMRNIAEGNRIWKNYCRKGKLEEENKVLILDPAEMTNIDWWHTRELFLDLEFKTKWGVAPNFPMLQGCAVHLWRSQFKKLQKTKKISFNSPVVGSLYDQLTAKYADEFNKCLTYNYCF